MEQTAPPTTTADDTEPGPIDIAARADGPSRKTLDSGADISVLTALLRARKEHGGATIAVEDGDKRTLTYTELVRAVAAFSRVIRRDTEGDVVGIMLPSSAGAVIAYFAVLAAGKIPAMLNFTAGRGPLLAACRSARIGAILTSSRFLSVANLEPLADALSAAAPVLALEDLRTRVTGTDKAFAAVAAPLGLLPRHAADAPAAIVFTSGAEGNPKGVVLSHRNFMANTAQVVASLPLERAKIFFNPLPVFHSYGLGPGMILPLVLGRKLVLHPSPLRAKEVAQRIAETKANILLATDTFLRQYAKAAGDGSLSSLHFAVCGAERVRPETRELVRAKFGFVVVEGYGVTETSPVLAANHPDDIRDGTVGRLMPGIEARLVAVPGLNEGRRLLVRGPNIMAGYIDAETGAVRPPQDGWHDTGDIVSFEDGYMTIRGRLKRFAKIGGEMTSLAAVENLAGAAWPDALHAAAIVPGTTRGEAIVLITEETAPDTDRLREKLREQGLPERYLPRQVFTVPSLPLLGSGKVDYVSVTRMANELIGAGG
ncbi:AMP-binding protein [Acuticoccus sp. MNP-M23]|uniref:AMP-binding protein n=1 Tax=Acuticoccus sp. MNP-M23 TaxID=3072793 RepID=UPI002815B717|nr:AMP-binding protein [Acuticoccus sp. MNP-M23]WMS42336.1 AMP-binding protein [Acuticoccus sp. MNP-M23]